MNTASTGALSAKFVKRVNLTKYSLQRVEHEDGTPGQVYEMVIPLGEKYNAKLYATAEAVKESGYFSEQ